MVASSLLDGTPGLVLYLALKLGLYLSWSYVGVRWLSPGTGRPLLRGVALGVGRFLLGWVVGASVVPFILVAGALGHLSLFYFTGLGLVRWLEWGLIQSFIPSNPHLSVELLTAANARGRLWRCIGVVLSYLPDAPFLLAHGFPRGRFLC